MFPLLTAFSFSKKGTPGMKQVYVELPICARFPLKHRHGSNNFEGEGFFLKNIGRVEVISAPSLFFINIIVMKSLKKYTIQKLYISKIGQL